MPARTSFEALGPPTAHVGIGGWACRPGGPPAEDSRVQPRRAGQNAQQPGATFFPRLMAAAAAALLAALLATAPATSATAQTPHQGEPDAPARTLAVRVLRRLPHDPSAFTQGLVFHQGELVESTGLYRQSTLRRTDPETGRILALARLPGKLFGEGLALCPERPGAAPRLVLLTWREHLILTYDAVSLQRLGSQSLRGEGWGLAWDGARLILSDGSDTLRLLAPGDFAEIGQLKVRDGAHPVRELNELEWAQGWLLANVWGRDHIAVIRPPGAQNQGQVAAWLDLAPLRRELGPQAEAANGIAFDPRTQTLFVTGKHWDKVFVLALPTLLTLPPE
jgi:glutaminyl-peptide cyclotransferase